MTIATAMRDRLFAQLPAVYREELAPGVPNRLGELLEAFAQVLLGSGVASSRGLEEFIGGLQTETGPRTATGLPRYFDTGAQLDRSTLAPAEECAPDDFLPWLARWIALTLREDWKPTDKRYLVGHAARLYRLRGTKRGLEELLAIYTSLPASVDERSTPFQIGVHSRVDVDTIIGGGEPLFFHVKVKVAGPADVPKHEPIITALVELQKPAHTQYRLQIEGIPIFKVGTSQVDVNTIVG